MGAAIAAVILILVVQIARLQAVTSKVVFAPATSNRISYVGGVLLV